MAVEASTPRKSYAGNGVTTAFATSPFVFDEAEDLVVLLVTDSTGVAVQKTLTTHYTVSGGNEGAGVAVGTVTMLTAPATGETLVIYNDPTLTQGVEYRENNAPSAPVQENALDRLTLICQRLADRIDRSMAADDGFSDTFDFTLPALLTASRVIGINGDGDGFELFELGDGTDIGLPSGTGLVTYLGAGLFSDVFITTSGNGISVTNGTGVSGNPTLALDAGLDEFSAYTARTILAGQVFS